MIEKKMEFSGYTMEFSGPTSQPNFSSLRKEILYNYFQVYGGTDMLEWAEYVMDHLEEIQKAIATFTPK